MADYDQYPYIEKRLRYFDGQFLKDQDFIDEQKYHIDRQRRANRLLNVAGILEGLVVTAGTEDDTNAPSTVTVTAGSALDTKGRQILLSKVKTVDLNPLIAEDSAAKNQTTLSEEEGETLLWPILLIEYDEVASDPSTEGLDGERRWHEQAKFIVSSHNPPATAVVLALLQIDPDTGVVTVQDYTRVYSGIGFPAQDGNRVVCRSSGPYNLSLLGSLQIEGGLSVGGRIRTESNLRVEGSFFAKGKATLLDGIDIDRGSLNIEAGSLQVEGTGQSSFAGSVQLGSSLTVKGTDTSSFTGRVHIDGPPGDGSSPGSLSIGPGERNLRLGKRDTYCWIQSHTPLALNPAGNHVGIGTTDPQAILDVHGRIMRKGKNFSFVGTAGDDSAVRAPWGTTEDWNIFVSINSISTDLRVLAAQRKRLEQKPLDSSTGLRAITCSPTETEPFAYWIINCAAHFTNGDKLSGTANYILIPK